MEISKSNAELNPREMRERARDYRTMAETAQTAETRNAYLRVAERLEARATELEQSS
jgi:hypothetical protein